MTTSTDTGVLVGVFDMLGIEDIDLVRDAAGRCGRLVVAVATDGLAQELHGYEPVIPAVERAAILAALRGVAEVVNWDAPDLSDVLVGSGGATVFADGRWGGSEWLAGVAVAVELLAVTRHSAGVPDTRETSDEDVA